MEENKNNLSQADDTQTGQVSGLGKFFNAGILSGSMQGVSVVLNFLILVVLTRSLGGDKFGLFSFIKSWLIIAAQPLQFGVFNFLLRKISKYDSLNETGKIRSLVKLVRNRTFSFCVVVTLLAAAVMIVIPRFFNVDLSYLLPVVILGCLMILVQVVQGIFSGLHHVLLGRSGYSVLAPVFTLLFLGSIYLFADASRLRVWQVYVLMGVANLFTLIILAFFLKPKYASISQSEFKPLGDVKITEMLPFVLMTLLGMINMKVSQLMLGFLCDMKTVGFFEAASNISLLVILPQLAFNTVLAPNFSAMFTKGKFDELQKLVTFSIRMITGFSLVVLIGIFIFGKFILSIFRPEFLAGSTAMFILSSSFVFTVGAGSVSLLLMMTDNRKIICWVYFWAVVINLVLSVILISLFGLNGAAIACGAGLVFQNFMLAYYVKKRLNIRSWFLG